VTRTTQINQNKPVYQEDQGNYPKVPTIFSKERKVENAKAEQYVPPPPR
jgi:hypothetical protein